MKILIDTEWATFIEDLPVEKQLEFFWAVFDFGNRECSLKCWSKIQPILQKGKIGYYNKLKNLKHVSGRVIEPSIESNIDSSIDSTIDTTVERGSVSVSKRKYIKENDVIVSGIRASKFTPPTLQEVIDYAAEQTQWRGVGGFRCPRSVAEEFWAHYDSQGWKKSNDSATPVTNWQSALRLWAKKQHQFEKPQPDLPV